MAKRWWVLGLGAVAGSSFLIYKAITRRPLVDLHDRVVAITGAASGIGLATAHICAAHGARLVLLDEDAGELAEAAAALAIYDTDVLPLPVSFTDAAAVEAAVEAIYARFDRLDVLVNAAIRLLGGLLPDQDPARLQTALERDLYSAVRLTQLIVPRMVAQPPVARQSNTYLCPYVQSFPEVVTTALEQAGDHAATIEHFRQAHALVPDSWTFRRQAWSLEPGGDSPMARFWQGPSDDNPEAWPYEGDWLSDVRETGAANYSEPWRP